MTPAPRPPASCDPQRLTQAGNAAYLSGEHQTAAGLFRAALARDPGALAARVNLANALWAVGDYAAARDEAERALAAHPQSPEGWMILGAVRLDGGDPRGSVAAYTMAAALKPGFAPAQEGLAAALLAAEDPAGAEQAARRALALNPSAHALFSLASAKLKRRQPAAALALFDRLLAAAPQDARARHNRAHALIELGQLASAQTALRDCLALDPRLKEAWATLGYLLTIEADLPGAIHACEQALALDPDFAVAHWNRGVALLLGGDFAGGFAAYEWRKRHPLFRHHFTALPGRAWRGEDLRGAHLLVRAEQGLGDTIMLARFLPGLAARAARLTLCCPPSLHPLFRRFGIALADLHAAPAADYAVDQMSLPYLLGIGEHNIPGAAGYLRAEPGSPAGEILAGKRPRIGVVWAGNPGHDNDHHRSLAPGALTPLLALEQFSFISLQLGARQGEYAIPQAAPFIRDYGDTAAIVSRLDAVVSVDSSVAHLTGALALPCHLLISKACDWRWRLGRADTPWYDTLTLHRQQRLDDWEAPVASVIAALAPLARR